MIWIHEQHRCQAPVIPWNFDQNPLGGSHFFLLFCTIFVWFLKNSVTSNYEYSVSTLRDSNGGWPANPEDLKVKVLEAWDAVPLSSFRELVRSYRVRLQAIHSVDGDRHPQFAWGLWGRVTVRVTVRGGQEWNLYIYIYKLKSYYWLITLLLYN